MPEKPVEIYSGISIMIKYSSPLIMEGKVTYQGLPRNYLVIPYLSSISISIRIEQSTKSYLLSETLLCIHEEAGNFMRSIDFSKIT